MHPDEQGSQPAVEPTRRGRRWRDLGALALITVGVVALVLCLYIVAPIAALIALSAVVIAAGAVLAVDNSE